MCTVLIFSFPDPVLSSLLFLSAFQAPFIVVKGNNRDHKLGEKDACYLGQDEIKYCGTRFMTLKASPLLEPTFILSTQTLLFSNYEHFKHILLKTTALPNLLHLTVLQECFCFFENEHCIEWASYENDVFLIAVEWQLLPMGCPSLTDLFWLIRIRMLSHIHIKIWRF